jgi:hypothetical protein
MDNYEQQAQRGTETPRRRVLDAYSTIEIEAMIMEEDDPKQRAHLILMNAFKNAIDANTHAIRSITERFDKHQEAFFEHKSTQDNLMHQGKGAWQVMAVVGAAIYAVLVALVLWAGVKIIDLDKKMDTSNARLIRVEEALKK